MKKRADGRYCRKVNINGKDVFFYSSAATERQATRDIERQMIEYKEKERQGKKFSEVAEEWAEYHFPTLENNTLKQYKPALKNALEAFSDRYIKDITSNQIDLYIKMFAKKGYAQKTVKSRLLVLNLIFKYAVIHQYTDTNPCLYISVPKNLPKTKREGLTAEQIEIVKASVDAPFGLFAFFLLNTGLRKGEALALRYGDIDFNRKVVCVNKTVEWVGNVPAIKNHPKTDAGVREVPLLDCLNTQITRGNAAALVFPNYKDELIRNGNFTRLWNKYRAATDLTITPHQLRHAYATMLYDAGVDIKSAQYLLGHANIQTTMDIYTHLSRSRQSTAADLLNSFTN